MGSCIFLVPTMRVVIMPLLRMIGGACIVDCIISKAGPLSILSVDFRVATGRSVKL